MQGNFRSIAYLSLFFKRFVGFSGSEWDRPDVIIFQEIRYDTEETLIPDVNQAEGYPFPRPIGRADPSPSGRAHPDDTV